MSGENGKRRAAILAAERIEPGTRLGLGTGSTAALFVAALGERVAAGLDVLGVPTSEATRAQAEALGIRLATLEEQPVLDLTVDGADELDPALSLIKGGGGALLREKLVAAASARMWVVADAGKQVETLGRFPLPIEIVPFGAETTRRRIAACLGDLGLPQHMTPRQDRAGRPFLTDGGHLILDLHLGAIPDPVLLADRLDRTLGIVDHGLFLGLATAALIGTEDGVGELGRF